MDYRAEGQGKEPWFSFMLHDRIVANNAGQWSDGRAQNAHGHDGTNIHHPQRNGGETGHRRAAALERDEPTRSLVERGRTVEREWLGPVPKGR
jgi:hypothetical protein